MLLPAHRELLKTLCGPQRFEIMLHLMGGPLNVTQIGARTGIGQTAVSHHLKRLLQCHFVVVKKRGKERLYAANTATAGRFFKLLDAHAKKYCQRFCCSPERRA